jgi:hypothetical protein
MSDEMRAMSVFDNKMLGGLTVFNDIGSDDPVDQGVRIVEIVDTEADEIEFSFETFNPKRRTYLRFNKNDLAIVLAEALT